MGNHRPACVSPQFANDWNRKRCYYPHTAYLMKLMKPPSLTSLIYLPVVLLALFVGTNLLRSWKEIQHDEGYPAAISTSLVASVTSSVHEQPSQPASHSVSSELSAPSLPLENLQPRSKSVRPSSFVSQSTYSPGSSFTPPVPANNAAAVVSTPSQNSVISTSPSPYSGSSPSPGIQASRPATISSAPAPSSYGSSYTPVAIAPPVFSAPTGVQSGAAAISGGSSSAPAAASAAAPAVSIPAAFADPASAGISTPNQNQQISQIADNFTSAVQNSGVSPSSPGYQNVWNTASQQANAIFRQQFGNAAFEAAQINANSQSANSQ